MYPTISRIKYQCCQPKHHEKHTGHSRESPLGVLDYRLLMKESWNATVEVVTQIDCGVTGFDTANGGNLFLDIHQRAIPKDDTRSDSVLIYGNQVHSNFFGYVQIHISFSLVPPNL